MADERSNLSDSPFTSDERRELRRIIRNEEYARRFWSNVRIWLGWSSGTIIFVFTMWDKIKGHIPWIN